MTLTAPATGAASAASRLATPWWREAVVYQVYIRSFADGDGDGTGDLAGLRARLPYLASLGVDALWINPWYPSPMADSGYDVADYRGIEPLFGDLDQASVMIAEAHELGLRIILDLVPNHLSDEHAWFQAALASAPGSPERARFIFRGGRGESGELPPNDWTSHFGGPAWTRVVEAVGDEEHPAGQPGQWYLHLFNSKQPDVNWTSDEVRAEFDEVLRFWFDRGVDGFRIDVAHGLIKHPDFPDLGERERPHIPFGSGDHPFLDRDEVHEVYRGWRAIADSYDPPRVFVAEAWTGDAVRLGMYLRPDELHTAFNFDFLVSAWREGELRSVIDATLAAHAAVGAPPTWVLSNHDVYREVSRYAREQDRPQVRDEADVKGRPADLELGLRRARAAALLMLALPGGAYVYQGAELGLPEVEDLPEESLQDPTWFQSGGQLRGRDGCRVPLPWSGSQPPFGFSERADGAAPTGEPWLPQPASFAGLTVADQDGDPTSTLELYRSALALRHSLEALGDGSMSWVQAADGSLDGVLAFTREPGFACWVNLSPQPVELPDGVEVLLSSGDLDETADGAVLLPSDTTVWLRR
ncbi:alpha-glucosidase [Quadrisphaera granulorum]|uniref:Alpha-glucosidase n=1 Tax=Quadrisphaera granulorum TaxID=317664 RepID=A0A316A7S9_9ACTN|nr:glycoside hydrolase family 13 protein [Quadrisphaera granulorum]PWJ45797.1 alpha-glucosidase [Quadrisphaera granulorum]SZE99131.1 alpha-glucosidase [Quadrisphaera granulorum]